MTKTYLSQDPSYPICPLLHYYALNWAKLLQKSFFYKSLWKTGELQNLANSSLFQKNPSIQVIWISPGCHSAQPHQGPFTWSSVCPEPPGAVQCSPCEAALPLSPTSPCNSPLVGSVFESCCSANRGSGLYRPKRHLQSGWVGWRTEWESAIRTCSCPSKRWFHGLA